MITISRPEEIPIEKIHKALRHYGTKWCRLSCGNPEALLAFAALNGVALKFFQEGCFVVPAGESQRLIEAGAEKA